MRLAISHQSADALRELSEKTRRAVSGIEDDTAELQRQFELHREGLGPHEEAFEDIFRMAQEAITGDVRDCFDSLCGRMERLADSIDDYVNKCLVPTS